jgi:hypothetical protein
MFVDFWDLVLNPIFLITFGLVLAAFLPLVLSIWATYMGNEDHPEHE